LAQRRTPALVVVEKVVVEVEVEALEAKALVELVPVLKQLAFSQQLR
jgi:hypothetical protein